MPYKVPELKKLKHLNWINSVKRKRKALDVDDCLFVDNFEASRPAPKPKSNKIIKIKLAKELP